MAGCSEQTLQNDAILKPLNTRRFCENIIREKRIWIGAEWNCRVKQTFSQNIRTLNIIWQINYFTAVLNVCTSVHSLTNLLPLSILALSIFALIGFTLHCLQNSLK